MGDRIRYDEVQDIDRSIKAKGVDVDVSEMDSDFDRIGMNITKGDNNIRKIGVDSVSLIQDKGRHIDKTGTRGSKILKDRQGINNSRPKPIVKIRLLNVNCFDEGKYIDLSQKYLCKKIYRNTGKSGKY